ncbi:putative Agglutinin-like protein 7-like, partial [Homarus americanus]
MVAMIIDDVGRGTRVCGPQQVFRFRLSLGVGAWRLHQEMCSLDGGSIEMTPAPGVQAASSDDSTIDILARGSSPPETLEDSRWKAGGGKMRSSGCARLIHVDLSHYERRTRIGGIESEPVTFTIRGQVHLTTEARGAPHYRGQRCTSLQRPEVYLTTEARGVPHYRGQRCTSLQRPGAPHYRGQVHLTTEVRGAPHYRGQVHLTTEARGAPHYRGQVHLTTEARGAPHYRGQRCTSLQRPEVHLTTVKTTDQTQTFVTLTTVRPCSNLQQVWLTRPYI